MRSSAWPTCCAAPVWTTSRRTWCARCAARPLQQILVNLVANAIKFTEEGAITIRLAGEAVTPERVALRIAVEDTGIGIPQEAQERIFERFTQADESTTRRY